MFDISTEAQDFEQNFPIFFHKPSSVEEITHIVKNRGSQYIQDLDYDAEDFYKAAQNFTSMAKAMLLQKSFVGGYFYANFETAELIFKDKNSFCLFYSMADATSKYEVFIFQAEKFLKTAEPNEYFTQKIEKTVTETHFKLGVIFGMNEDVIKSMHHLSQAQKFGHVKAEMLIQTQTAPQTLAA
jgi:hypothetical protein